MTKTINHLSKPMVTNYLLTDHFSTKSNKQYHESTTIRDEVISLRLMSKWRTEKQINHHHHQFLTCVESVEAVKSEPEARNP